LTGYLDKRPVNKYHPDRVPVCPKPDGHVIGIFLYPFPNCNMWLLFLMDANDLAASLKLLELKYESTAHI
jgi:hypothetical protein